MTSCSRLRAKRNANPSTSTRHTTGPETEQRPVRRDKLEPNLRAAPEGHLGADLRTLRADVHRVARVATGPHFDEHGPRYSGSRMLLALALLVANVTQ